MRDSIVLLLVAALIVSGCGRDAQPRERPTDERPRKSTTVVEYPEIEGGWAFIEGYEVVVQFLGEGGWSDPKPLAPRATVKDRQYYGSAVRMTVCERPCADTAEIVDRPEAIRCQVRSNQHRGRRGQLRITPRLVRDRDGDIGCSWAGRGIVEESCNPSEELDGPVDRRRLVSPAELSDVRRFVFVERHGCSTSTGGVRFTMMGWEGSFDCNSAAGRWRVGPGTRVRFGTNTSTTIACGAASLDIAPQQIAYVERLASGDVRLLDEHWFPLAVTAPVRSVPDAFEAPDKARIAVEGTIVARGDEVRICSGVFASSPPTCGDVGGRTGFVGSTLRVENLDLDDYESKESGGVLWVDEAALVGRRVSGVLKVE